MDEGGDDIFSAMYLPGTQRDTVAGATSDLQQQHPHQTPQN